MSKIRSLIICLQNEVEQLVFDTVCQVYLGKSRDDHVFRHWVDYNRFFQADPKDKIKLQKTVEISKNFLLEWILKTVEDHATSSDLAKNQDFASKYLNAQQMTKEQIQSEIFHNFWAGYSLVLLVLDAFIHLHTHSQVMRELKQELVAKMAEKQEKKISGHDLQSLPTLHKVVMETQRLGSNQAVFPVSYGVTAGDVSVRDGDKIHVTIPQGSVVLMSYYLSNLNPSTFTQPLSFDINRYRNSNSSSNHYNHFSFGASPASAHSAPHRCLAMDFVTMFLKIVLASVVSEYEWTFQSENYEVLYSDNDVSPRFPVFSEGLPIHFFPDTYSPITVPFTNHHYHHPHPLPPHPGTLREQQQHLKDNVACANNAVAKRAKIVVIGGGVSGLTMGYWLQKEGYTDVTILDAEDKLTVGKSETVCIDGKNYDLGAYFTRYEISPALASPALLFSLIYLK